jgi:hypothetical protein
MERKVSQRLNEKLMLIWLSTLDYDFSSIVVLSNVFRSFFAGFSQFPLAAVHKKHSAVFALINAFSAATAEPHENVKLNCNFCCLIARRMLRTFFF